MNLIFIQDMLGMIKRDEGNKMRKLTKKQILLWFRNLNESSQNVVMASVVAILFAFIMAICLFFINLY
jgi:hypothetical protein